MFSRAMTEPGGRAARHYTRALMGMKISALETPKAIISRERAAERGIAQPRINKKVATPAAPSGTSPYSTCEQESRLTTNAPTPMPTEISAEGRLPTHPERPSTALAYTSTFLNDEARDGPEKHRAGNGQPE